MSLDRDAVAEALVRQCTVHQPLNNAPWPDGLNPQVVEWALRAADAVIATLEGAA